jgi:NitT/TauT family transport system substrate-binding protein
MLTFSRKIIKILLYIQIVTAFTLILGCGSVDSTPLRLGTTLWPGYEPLHLAVAMGYLDKQTIQLVDSTSPNGSIQGLRNGDLDAVALTLDEVLLLVDQHVPLQVVLVFDFSNGGDAIIAQPEIDNVEALKGKQVGLESTALGTYLLSRALELHGLNTADVKKNYLKVSGHRQALEQGMVQAVVTFDPVRSELLAAGGHEIFSSRDIPNEIVDVLAVRQSYLEQHPQRVRELIDAWYRALDYFGTQPQAAAEIMAQRLKLSPAEVLEGFSSIQLTTRAETLSLMQPGEGHPAPLVESARRLSTLMHKQQMLHQGPAPEALITPAYLH